VHARKFNKRTLNSLLKLENMEDYNLPKKSNKFKWLSVLLVVVIAGLIAFAVANNNDNNKKSANTTAPSAQPSNSSSSVDSLISYQLPDGWSKVSCGGENDVTLIVPANRMKPDCASLADSWPMKIAKDPKNTTECSQIKVNSQQITNHVCSSQFINGQKVFVASTIFNEKSPYGKSTKVSDYYVETNNGVLKLEYADDQSSAEDDYQQQFDQIANSIHVK
jgi:hypothetical protein